MAELVYSHAGIDLWLGDCRDVLPLLPDESIDLVLTDPPYGIGYSPGSGGKGWTNGRKTFAGTDLVEGDNQPFDPEPLLRFRRLILFGANHYADRLPPSPTWIVWDKREGRVSNDFADCELAWSNCGGPARVFHHLWCGAFRASERGVARVHPTQKPLALMLWVAGQFSKPSDLILDPYAGSGTTLVAAKQLGRRAIGIEIEPRYIEIAIKRLAQEVMPLEEEHGADVAH